MPEPNAGAAEQHLDAVQELAAIIAERGPILKPGPTFEDQLDAVEKAAAKSAVASGAAARKAWQSRQKALGSGTGANISAEAGTRAGFDNELVEAYDKLPASFRHDVGGVGISGVKAGGPKMQELEQTYGSRDWVGLSLHDKAEVFVSDAKPKGEIPTVLAHELAHQHQERMPRQVVRKIRAAHARDQRDNQVLDLTDSVYDPVRPALTNRIEAWAEIASAVVLRDRSALRDWRTLLPETVKEIEAYARDRDWVP